MSIREWLDSVDKTPEWLARQLGRPTNTVRRWMSGRHFPRDADDIRRIEELSGGLVTASDVLLRPTPKGRPGRPSRWAA